MVQVWCACIICSVVYISSPSLRILDGEVAACAIRECHTLIMLLLMCSECSLAADVHWWDRVRASSWSQKCGFYGEIKVQCCNEDLQQLPDIKICFLVLSWSQKCGFYGEIKVQCCNEDLQQLPDIKICFLVPSAAWMLS